VIKNHFCSIVNNNQQPEKKLVPVRRTKKNLKGFSEDIYYLIKIVAEQLFNNDALLKKVFKSTDLNEQCDQIADLYCEIEELKQLGSSISTKYNNLEKEFKTLKNINSNNNNNINNKINNNNLNKSISTTTPIAPAAPSTSSFASVMQSNSNSFTNLLSTSTKKRFGYETDLVNKQNTKQSKLLSFNSSRPGEPNQPISNSNDGFKTKLSNNQKRTERSEAQKKNYERAAHNRNYLKSVGTDRGTSFKTQIRNFTVYIGRIETTNSKEALQSMISKVIDHTDLTEKKTAHNKFLAYTFNINYLDKDLIKDKSKWPYGLVINRYFRPKVTTDSSENLTANSIAP
jgi:hypothetical protein